MPYKTKEQEAEYQRGWYERNREHHIERAKLNRKAHHERRRKMIDEAKDVPCVDCGARYPPYVMDFDHLGDKVDNLASSKARDWSLQRIKAEIEKCEVVCANCHRERTHQRRVGGESGNHMSVKHSGSRFDSGLAHK